MNLTAQHQLVRPGHGFRKHTASAGTSGKKIEDGLEQAAIFYKNNPAVGAAVANPLGHNGDQSDHSRCAAGRYTFQHWAKACSAGQTEINATG